jgi:hypothetical protein
MVGATGFDPPALLLHCGAASHCRHAHRPALGSPCRFLVLHQAPWMVCTCLTRATYDSGFGNSSPCFQKSVALLLHVARSRSCLSQGEKFPIRFAGVPFRVLLFGLKRDARARGLGWPIRPLAGQRHRAR